MKQNKAVHSYNNNISTKAKIISSAMIFMLCFLTNLCKAEFNVIDKKINDSTLLILTSIMEDRQQKYSATTGILVSDDGLIATSAHLLFDYSSHTMINIIADIEATFDFKNYFLVDPVIIDIDRDVSIFKIRNKQQLPNAINLAENLPTIGTKVKVLGYPYIFEFSKQNFIPTTSITEGIVSSIKERKGYMTEKIMNIIEFDATTNPGNSGGAVYDSASGNVYGIVRGTLKLGSGINFAIPAKYITSLISKSTETKKSEENFSLYINGIKNEDKTIFVKKEYKNENSIYSLGKYQAEIAIELQSNIEIISEDIFVDIVLPREVKYEVKDKNSKSVDVFYDQNIEGDVSQIELLNFNAHKDIKRYICKIHFPDINYGGTRGYLKIGMKENIQIVEFEIYFE